MTAADHSSASGPRWLARDALQRLLDAILGTGYRLLGPVVRDGAVVFAPVTRVEELAVGWQDRQEPGRYRLERSGRGRVFDVVNGPGSLKPFVFAPTESLVAVEIEGDGGPGAPFRARPLVPNAPRLAILGVRACDLAGLAVQDRIFLRGRFPDPYYAARRHGLLLVAASCTRSVATCFCTSMGTGPKATQGFDISLTELDDGFLVRAGSSVGEAVVAPLALPAASAEARDRERAAIDACAAGITRRLDTHDLPNLLYENLDHPRWDDVAERCLSCGNCTMVCPTCFCHDERDEPALDARSAVRVREWDSCFNRDHAQVHGMCFRPRIHDRYRQWLVHKVASWIDQFGTSGCVGCGRCIAWCPVGIDLTQEVAAIRGECG